MLLQIVYKLDFLLMPSSYWICVYFWLIQYCVCSRSVGPICTAAYNNNGPRLLGHTVCIWKFCNINMTASFPHSLCLILSLARLVYSQWGFNSTLSHSFSLPLFLFRSLSLSFPLFSLSSSVPLLLDIIYCMRSFTDNIHDNNDTWC